MPTPYTYSKSIDFTSGWKAKGVHCVIEETLPGLLDPLGIEVRGDQIKIWFTSALSSVNKNTLDGSTLQFVNSPPAVGSILGDHIGRIPLSHLKAKRNKEIKERTKEILNETDFTYDSNNFPMTSDSIQKYFAFAIMKEVLVWPVDISTSDNTEYSLEEANLDAFLGTALAIAQSIKNAGRAIRVSITDAVDYDAVDAIIDNR
jgi:hypothetical protein